VEGDRAVRLGKPAARLAGNGRMIQITAQMRVLVAIEPVDGRKGPCSALSLRIFGPGPATRPHFAFLAHQRVPGGPVAYLARDDATEGGF